MKRVGDVLLTFRPALPAVCGCSALPGAPNAGIHHAGQLQFQLAVHRRRVHPATSRRLFRHFRFAGHPPGGGGSASPGRPDPHGARMEAAQSQDDGRGWIPQINHLHKCVRKPEANALFVVDEGEGSRVSTARAAALGPAHGSPRTGTTRPRSQTPAAHGTRTSTPGSNLSTFHISIKTKFIQLLSIVINCYQLFQLVWKVISYQLCIGPRARSRLAFKQIPNRYQTDTNRYKQIKLI